MSGAIGSRPSLPQQALGCRRDVGHQLRRPVKIPVCVSEVRMPHIGHQCDGMPRDRVAARAALCKDPCCEGMARSWIRAVSVARGRYQRGSGFHGTLFAPLSNKSSLSFG